MRTVGLFGGSFNPPHVGHLLAALYVLETAPIQELWFVPTWKHALGKELAASFDDRIAMCELAAAALGPRAQVSRAEEEVARTRGENRTLFLCEHLAAVHPDLGFRLIIGADILHETHRWHRWDDVCRLAPPIVLGRGGVVPPPGAHVSDVMMPEVSSTEIRRRLAMSADVSGLVPREILGYIARRGLFR
ncbi:MAG TPA: nicotinate-nicotinamide nucleotide adenylyltransferase [Kofleriaceae bacterium]|jgi:nicotinate-nucleotide adenylyltransferase|nr:nicotinate-nicotinamide nucleotide adenylyltransferase [Kofleriaceae bacterium]